LSRERLSILSKSRRALVDTRYHWDPNLLRSQITGIPNYSDFSDIHLEADERPEDLYQRLTAFVEDNLLRVDGLAHHAENITEDEELSPSLENLVVLTWLRLIHSVSDLPKLVKQRYGTELRSRTLASIKPEILCRPYSTHVRLLHLSPFGHTTRTYRVNFVK
jgi:hypothetical protein